MDKDVVLNKLESLRRCLQRVQDKTPMSVDRLVEDYDLQDIITEHLDDFRDFAQQILNLTDAQ